MNKQIHLADNLTTLQSMQSNSIDLIYIDPPFNTGKTQKRARTSYPDSFKYFESFIKPRLIQSHRILKPHGSFFLHIDYREAHYCKIWLDKIFGRENFQNEIIWAYDYGGRSKRKWSAKHDTILWYTMHPERYTFNFNAMDRIPYMAPGLAGKEKAARGKTPTDCWWHTIVPTNGKEKTGYPTQKPMGILRRIIKVHTNPGDLVLDFFAGSGTTGDAAGELGRDFILIDNNPDAVDVMSKRLAKYNPVIYNQS
ncbi:MAG: site-specific DNA-methyltransferase [Alphaproteobacteria bacterium]|nr:site-specific DNA-methyltransferase [Alphaproteobacteria bacterium]